MKAPLLASVAIASAALAWVQWGTEHLVDGDSYYHARYAELLPRRGLSRTFEWTQESVWKDRFSDKEFLYHLWLAPFCRGSHVVFGAKVAAWLASCGLVAGLAWILLRQEIRWPWLWTLLVAGLGNHFLVRIEEVRPHTLSVLLALLGIHFLMRRRWKAVAVAGFVYSWSYAAPHLLVGFAIIDAATRWALALRGADPEGREGGAVDRRWEWRGMAAAAGGVLAGLVIHPYFPNDLSMWWIINVKILGQAWISGTDVVKLGAEFGPATTRSFLDSSTLAALCLAGSLMLPAMTGAAISRRSKSLIAFQAGAFLLFCMSAKFIDYFAPIALLTAASVASDLWPATPPRWLAPAGLLVGLLLAVRSLHDARHFVSTLPKPALRGVATWIRDHVPPGETVVHLDWGDFVQLFHFDPTHRYLVGLDPMFMYVAHPQRMALLESILQGVPFDPVALSRTFGSKWLVVHPRQQGIPEASGLTATYVDEGGAVYRLAD